MLVLKCAQLEIIAHIAKEGFVVAFANHSGERVTNRFLVDVIAFEFAVDREETEDCFGTDIGFDEPEAFPFGTETDGRFEDGIILAAVDES